ncbi:hypothetical protein DL95DRAFT_476561 [Leptodontidium sp. 2 PMI_412]|nr:hypothetical protein DL95DRAFT_476561 [Leptodontidium sp. 2 PMI_412]
MQSFLAHKRFEKHALDQYERDRKRTEQLDRGNTENKNDGDADNIKTAHRPSSLDENSLNAEIPSNPHSPDSRDPKKREQPGREEQNGDPSSAREQDGIQRNNTLSTIRTNESFGTRMGQAMTGIEAAVSWTNTNGSKEQAAREKVFVVGYESEKDNMNPHNWSLTTRVGATILIAFIGLIVGFASSVDSAAITQAVEEFGASEGAESLATGLLLIGFVAGALFAGPFSDRAQLIFRFLAGFFGSTPLSCTGGSTSDLWGPMERFYAFPVRKRRIHGSHFRSRGRWIHRTEQPRLVAVVRIDPLIISGLIFVLFVLFQPETFSPIFLKWKAAHLRKITGDERYATEVDSRADSFWKRLTHTLYRPFLLTVRELIVILFSLAFLGIAVGLCFASLLLPLIYTWAKRYLAAAQASHGPNARLPLRSDSGSLCLALQLISCWSGLLSSMLFGNGILCIFISSYQYIIDSYEMYAASVLASLTLIQYVAASGMTVVGIPFCKNVEVHWTFTILA